MDLYSVSKTTRQKFGQGEWAKVLGLVAAGSRLGSLGSSLLYGGILRAGVDMVPARILKVVGVEAGLAAGAGSWRVVFKVAAASPASTPTTFRIRAGTISTPALRIPP